MSRNRIGRASRKELVAARTRIERQIEMLENPLRFYGEVPEVVAKLRSMLADIDSCLTPESPEKPL